MIMKVATFVRFYYGGKFGNRYTVLSVDDRDPRRITVKDGAYAFHFFDVELTFPSDSANSTSKETRQSSKYFVAGRVMTLEEVRREFPSEEELLFNLRSAGCSAVLMTKSGDFYPFDPSTCVLLSQD